MTTRSIHFGKYSDPSVSTQLAPSAPPAQLLVPRMGNEERFVSHQNCHRPRGLSARSTDDDHALLTHIDRGHGKLANWDFFRFSMRFSNFWRCILSVLRTSLFLGLGMAGRTSWMMMILICCDNFHQRTIRLCVEWALAYVWIVFFPWLLRKKSFRVTYEKCLTGLKDKACSREHATNMGLRRTCTHANDVCVYYRFYLPVLTHLTWCD